jgi:hypothetical protein
MTNQTLVRKYSTGFVALAAFAAVILTVYFQFRWNRAIIWEESDISLPAFRGPEGEARPPVYAVDILRSFESRLRATLMEKYKEKAPKPAHRSWFGSNSEWVLGTRLNELFEGTLLVEVRASPVGSKEPLKTWTQEFADAQECEAGIRPFGEQVAAELAALRSNTAP